MLTSLNHPILDAASVHNVGVMMAAMFPLAPAHVLLVDKVGYPYAPTVFFRQEPRPSLTKHINPLADVHSTSWQVQSARFASEPSVLLQEDSVSCEATQVWALPAAAGALRRNPGLQAEQSS